MSSAPVMNGGARSRYQQAEKKPTAATPLRAVSGENGTRMRPSQRTSPGSRQAA